MRAKYLVSCAIAAIMTGSAGAAAAADAAAGPSAIEEIIVTAQRRDQSLESVPMTIQAFSGNQLAARSITTFDDLIKLTPNVEFAKNGTDPQPEDALKNIYA